MIPHETIPIFGISWWQSNIITILIIYLVLLLGKRSNQFQRIQIAKMIGGVMISRAILIHFYMVYLDKVKILSRITCQNDLQNYKSYLFNMFLFEDEHSYKKKIRLQLCEN